MPTLSERLKKLGLQLGTEGLMPRAGNKAFPIEKVVEGQALETPYGETFVLETLYPPNFQHGQAELKLSAPMEVVAAWARDSRIAACPSSGFAFLDTETTGLGGGSGTYAFLVGIGRFEEEGFRLAQFFMRDPIEEPALLAGIEEFLTPCETLVTFNGKAFDIPLLNARHISNGNKPPFTQTAHLDLLHLARRLWRLRLPSRALGYLEKHILGEVRSEEDVPGWMIPQIYIDYLRSGDARPLRGIFYHNAMDILSLAALTGLTAGMLAEPLEGEDKHPEDLVSIGKLFEDLGQLEKAAQLFEVGLSQGLPSEIQASTTKRLSYLHRRRQDYETALSLWREAAERQEIYAHVELAKYYEHKERDFEEAARLTWAALETIRAPDYPRYKRIYWEEELEYRLARLERKLAK